LLFSDDLRMDSQVIIPCPAGDDYAEIELARDRQAKGTVFRKHLLNLGTLHHPKTGEALKLDDAWYGQLKANFDNQVCDIVQVPLADGQNHHTEDPRSNVGEVIGIEREGDKIYSLVDVRDPAAVEGLRNGTLLGASAFLHMDYKDTRTNRNVGPTLLHHCITNRPYVTGLEDYQEVVAATAGSDGDVVILSPPDASSKIPADSGGEPPTAEEPVVAELTRDELLEQLKAKHGIDVAALQLAAAQPPAAPSFDASQLTAALTAALQQAAPTLSLTAGQNADGKLELSDVVGAVAELAQQHRALGDQVVALTRAGAESEIDGYIAEGRVLPKQREAYVRMALTARDQLEVMLPDKAIVPLNAQVGSAGRPQGEQRQELDIDQEILRLTTENAGVFDPAAKRDPRARVIAANQAAALALTAGQGAS
jgi:hypothetical protein